MTAEKGTMRALYYHEVSAMLAVVKLPPLTALFVRKARKFEIKQVPIPVPNDNELLLKGAQLIRHSLA